jgi:glycosyltransferase involved in cell wall biosynthesis
MDLETACGATERTCVIIPAYCESALIGDVIRGAKRHLKRILVVDDGSPDNTAEVAAAEGAEVLRHDVNQGKGAALKTGLRHLLAEPFESFILLDGDGQHDPAEIPKFLAASSFSKAELILGNRFVNSREMPLVRRWTNRFMSWQIGRLSGAYFPDSQCGFRLLDRRLVRLLLDAGNGFEFETEMIFVAARHGFRTGSVGIQTIYRGEQSKIRPVRDTLRYFRLLRKYRNRKGGAEDLARDYGRRGSGAPID